MVSSSERGKVMVMTVLFVSEQFTHYLQVIWGFGEEPLSAGVAMAICYVVETVYVHFCPRICVWWQKRGVLTQPFGGIRRAAVFSSGNNRRI